jgi:NAD(P)-dependent dehydrogenase (short-subunit alcohol dehydrogenase family)
MERYDLNGKVALVTGAARGIGFETARQMHLRGASVAVLDLDAEQAREAAERIGPRAIGLGGDVTDQSALMNAVAEIVERFGGLDVAVANAGIAQKQFATVRGISGEEWERVFEVDMLGVWRTVRAALPQIVERKGQMIVVSSVYAFANGFGNSPYAVAKAGVESLGRALRAELKPHGASASVAYFGWVDTKLVQDTIDQADSSRVRELSPEWLLKRITPEEAGAGLVRGIEERAPRIFVPKWWRYVSALRGVLNPLLDKRMETEPKFAALVREIDAERSTRSNRGPSDALQEGDHRLVGLAGGASHRDLAGAVAGEVSVEAATGQLFGLRARRRGGQLRVGDAAVAGEGTAGGGGSDVHLAGEGAAESAERMGEIEASGSAGRVDGGRADLLADLQVRQQPQRPGHRVDDLDLPEPLRVLLRQHPLGGIGNCARTGRRIDHYRQRPFPAPLPQPLDHLIRLVPVSGIEPFRAPRQPTATPRHILRHHHRRPCPRRNLHQCLDNRPPTGRFPSI